MLKQYLLVRYALRGRYDSFFFLEPLELERPLQPGFTLLIFCVKTVEAVGLVSLATVLSAVVTLTS